MQTRVLEYPNRPTIYKAGHGQYEFDGQPVPNITSILGVIDKPGLRYWYAACAAEVVWKSRPPTLKEAVWIGRGAAQTELKELAASGTYVHDAIADDINGNDFPVAARTKKELTCLNNYLSYKANNMKNFSLIGTEMPVFSRSLGIAGTLDLAYKNLDDGVYYVVDWKSGNKIYPTQYLQGIFYARALEEEGLITHENIVHIVPLSGKTGNPYKPTSSRFTDKYNCLEMIKAAKTLYVGGFRQ